ncbi:MAG: hypothetical protein ACREBO_10070 [Novosphingobium sp.]
MPHSHQLKILDTLIVSAGTGVEGYRSAASETSNAALRLQFTDCAEAAEDVLLELETRVRQLGGEPAWASAPGPSARRPGRRYSVSMGELARRQAEIAQRFERALASTGLDADTRAALSLGVAVFRGGREDEGPRA